MGLGHTSPILTVRRYRAGSVLPGRAQGCMCTSAGALLAGMQCAAAPWLPSLSLLLCPGWCCLLVPLAGNSRSRASMQSSSYKTYSDLPKPICMLVIEESAPRLSKYFPKSHITVSLQKDSQLAIVINTEAEVLKNKDFTKSWQQYIPKILPFILDLECDLCFIPW